MSKKKEVEHQEVRISDRKRQTVEVDTVNGQQKEGGDKGTCPAVAVLSAAPVAAHDLCSGALPAHEHRTA